MSIFLRKIAALRTIHTKGEAYCLLFALLAGVVGLPYLAPTPIAVGLSSLTHFNNRVAVLLLIAAAIGLAWALRNIRPDNEALRDRSLGPMHLILSMLYVGLLCLLHFQGGGAEPHIFGQEAIYGVNRLEMLEQGLRPYRDFEFAYGPLQVWMPHLLTRLAGLSVPRAYYAWWAVQWLLGTAMLWMSLRSLAFALRWRPVIFWSLLVMQVPGLGTEGLAYTPVRMLGAMFFLIATNAAWRRGAFLGTAVGCLSVALALGISPEQGIGVAAGVSAGIAWMLWKQRSPRLVVAATTSWTGIAVLLLWANGIGMFGTLRAFAGGQYSFPLTLSVPLLLFLIAYALSACALPDTSDVSQAVMLLIGGFTLLPAALGRADLGHAQFAAPALILGIVYLQHRPHWFQWWTVAFVSLFCLPGVLSQAYAVRIGISTYVDAPLGSRPSLLPKRYAWPSPWFIVPTSSRTAMCPQRYITPSIWIPFADPANPRGCVQDGFYLGLVNVFTPDAMQRKIDEMRTSPQVPLLLKPGPLALSFPVTDPDIRMLAVVQGAQYLPAPRRSPVTFQPIVDYIQSHYRPERMLDGQLQVWVPQAR